MKKLFICNTLDKSTYSSANLYYVFNDFDFKIKSKSLLNNSYLLNDLALKYANILNLFFKLKYFNDLGLITMTIFHYILYLINKELRVLNL